MPRARTRAATNPTEHKAATKKHTSRTWQSSKMRACMICALIQPRNKFVSEGCPNCLRHIDLRDDEEHTDLVISEFFEGTIAMTKPWDSWVARYHRIDHFVRGTYAVKVIGNLPAEIERALSEEGSLYMPRDGRFVPGEL